MTILFALENEPKSVSQIIEQTGLSQPLVSFHLKVLREAGLIVTERRATFVFNSICDADLPKLIKQFKKYETEQERQFKTSIKFPCSCPPWMK